MAYASGAIGYCIDYQVTPAVELPDAGELVSAATSNPIAQAQQDFQPWVYRRLGKYRLYDAYSRANPNAPTAQPWVTSTWAQSNGSVAGTGIFHFQAGDPSLVTLDVIKNGAPTTFGPAVQQGDRIEFAYSFTAWMQAAADPPGAILFFPFVKNSNVGGEVDITAAGQFFDLFLGSIATGWPKLSMILRGSYTVPASPGAISIGIAMQADHNIATNADVRLVGPANISIKHYRKN